MAGHWSRLARAPEIAQVMTTGSSRLMRPFEVGSGTSHFYRIRPRDGAGSAAGSSARLTCDRMVTYSSAGGRGVQGPRRLLAPGTARRAVRRGRSVARRARGPAADDPL